MLLVALKATMWAAVLAQTELAAHGQWATAAFAAPMVGLMWYATRLYGRSWRERERAR